MNLTANLGRYLVFMCLAGMAACSNVAKYPKEWAPLVTNGKINGEECVSIAGNYEDVGFGSELGGSCWVDGENLGRYCRSLHVYLTRKRIDSYLASWVQITHEPRPDVIRVRFGRGKEFVHEEIIRKGSDGFQCEGGSVVIPQTPIYASEQVPYQRTDRHITFRKSIDGYLVANVVDRTVGVSLVVSYGGKGTSWYRWRKYAGEMP